MLQIVFMAITWGLLTIFVAFLLYGIIVAVLELSKLYRPEIKRLIDRDTAR